MKLLYPFSIIYGLITWLRNKFFDWGIFKEKRFDLPIIGIGNLSVGGTGKTPHIEFLISKLLSQFTIAVVSRGYGRSTKGFRYVSTDDESRYVGDEPLQIKKKFEKIIVAVGENRVATIERILEEHPTINLILLDDSFQHRYVKPQINILLTDYSSPFWNDLVLPAGRLREFSGGYRRATAIIITKCPEKISIQIPKYLINKPLFYSRIKYLSPVIIKGNLLNKVVLVTGIANPSNLINHLKEKEFLIKQHLKYPDHHNFNLNEINNILSKIEDDTTLITTEKDWVRLKPFIENEPINICYWPIGVEIENPPKDWLELK